MIRRQAHGQTKPPFGLEPASEGAGGQGQWRKAFHAFIARESTNTDSVTLLTWTVVCCPVGMARWQAAMRTAMPGARKRTASATHPANKDDLSHATCTSLLLPASQVTVATTTAVTISS